MHAWHAVPSTRFGSFIRAQFEHEARDLLSEEVTRIKGDRGEITEAYLREGPTIDEILDFAEEIDADLMVASKSSSRR